MTETLGQKWETALRQVEEKVEEGRKKAEAAAVSRAKQAVEVAITKGEKQVWLLERPLALEDLAPGWGTHEESEFFEKCKNNVSPADFSGIVNAVANMCHNEGLECFLTYDTTLTAGGLNLFARPKGKEKEKFLRSEPCYDKR